MHAVFVDFTKAFDTINRSKLMENPIARITKNILADNRVQIDDNITTSEQITHSKRGALRAPNEPTSFQHRNDGCDPGNSDGRNEDVHICGRHGDDIKRSR